MGISVATVFMVGVGKGQDWQDVFRQGGEAYVRRFGCVPPAVWVHPDAPVLETFGVPLFADAGIVPRNTIQFEVRV